ncbi:MAG: UDP-N-acetylmuramoyl-tripeptide--D-alanyl-D-alanine ligase MurF [Pseudomonadota bacterium]|jgi:UDP-N-acetylmuramoyl-tripeptide--D-alanyl-D-alanine ligase
MALTLTKEKLTEIVGGDVASTSEKMSFHGVVYDSREIQGGELFVALPGAQAHGHTFLDQAFSRGASLALIEDRRLLTDSPHKDRLVWVPDSLKAFWALAKWWREELNIPVLGVTGSVGKTTVKEIAAAILLKQKRGVYSLKSHNNHVGVPYTICRIDRTHEWAVLEMGMNHAGELRALTAIAQPNVAIITCIGPAHIENFGTLEGIARAKLEIAEGVRPGGKLVLNGDDPVLLKVAQELGRRGSSTHYFGGSGAPDMLVSGVTPKGLEGLGFTLTAGEGLGGGAVGATMSILGRHNAQNGAAAALGVKLLFPEFTLEAIAQGLAAFQAPLMRLSIKILANERRVIDDSYNANPQSMRAALDIGRDLVESGLRVGLVLGDMLELGERSGEYHAEIGRYAAGINPEFCVAVGPLSAAIFSAVQGAGIPAFQADSPEAAAHIARKFPFDILIVKASRGTGLDRTVKTLVEREGGLGE